MTTTTAVNGNATLQNYLNQQAKNIAADQASSTSSSSSSASSSATQGIFKNENTFLNILTTQLKNQDPTATTDTNQFTQELVQFAQVEQQLNTNKDLESLISVDKGTSGVRGALGYVGQYVAADTTDQISLQSGKGEVSYSLGAAAQNVSVNITNSSGTTVRTLSGPTNSGTNFLTWDGKDSSGNQLADGAYSFTITATDINKASVTVSNTRLIGQVTGVTSNSDGTVNLSLGGVSIASSAVEEAYTSSGVPATTTSTSTSANASSQSTSG